MLLTFLVRLFKNKSYETWRNVVDTRIHPTGKNRARRRPLFHILLHSRRSRLWWWRQRWTEGTCTYRAMARRQRWGRRHRKANKTFLPPDPSDAPCAPCSVLSQYLSCRGVAYHAEHRACRPNPRRCTCGARIPCGIPSPPRPIRPPNRCYSRRICETGKYSEPNTWPKWPTCFVHTGSPPIPGTLRSATNTIPTCSFGSSPRR